ncbi:hypothetical protein [Rhizorhabdus histidinilytica]|uniref:hypothetical protein n=1 Tax=Rhizorhabdus histidinilytica TaxID=439228 RepID=UPI00063F4455|nr:hypothetical protein [Sphingomonas sp. Y57]
MRYATLRDLDEAGLDIRVWCYGCARHADIWSGLWAEFERKGWSTELGDLPARFRCTRNRHDGTRHDVLIIPTKRPPPRPWAEEVAAFFHGSRAARKAESRG